MWRGRIIRQQYRRAMQLQRQQEKRSAMSVEDRTELVDLCLRTKRVIGKDRQGNLRLGSVNAAPLSPRSAAAADAATAAPPSPTSSAGALSTSTATTAPVNNNDFDPSDDDDQGCAICLDCFEVNDVVSFTKIANAPCHHVFHAECIKAWLVGYDINNRHDDCPSCRTNLILYHALKDKRKKMKKIRRWQPSRRGRTASRR